MELVFVLHDDISAGKRCVVGEIVYDGVDASTSHALMVVRRHIPVLAKYQHLVASERGQYCIDGCNNDRRVTFEWPNGTVKDFLIPTSVTSGSCARIVFTQRLCAGGDSLPFLTSNPDFSTDRQEVRRYRFVLTSICR